MKNRFLLLVLSLMGSQVLLAQHKTRVAKELLAFKNDTASYITQRILDRKAAYIGKPLDSLLKDLPAVIQYTNSDVPRNRNIFPSTSLYFSFFSDVLNKLTLKVFPQLVTITWAKPLDNKEFSELGPQASGGKWNQAAYNYYKDKIVGDITTVQY